MTIPGPFPILEVRSDTVVVDDFDISQYSCTVGIIPGSEDLNPIPLAPCLALQVAPGTFRALGFGAHAL